MPLSKTEIENESLILVALAKCVTEQGTRLIGELKQRPKYTFNLAMKALDSFIKEMETSMSKDNFKTLEECTDCFHDGINEFRNEIIKIREK